jgi:sulfate permease, SulP family
VLPAGFGLAVVTSVNLLITSRVVEHFRGRHKQLKAADADTELGAYSIANLCAGMFGAPLSVGIPARSLANLRCGGNSRLSIVLHAGAILFFLSAGSSFIAQIPLAALAGVVVFSGVCLLDWSTWKRLPHMRRVDATAFLSTAIAVLVVNALAAVLTGCLVYGVHWMYAKLSPPLQLQPARD